MQMAINAAVTADSLAKANARNKEILDKIDAQAADGGKKLSPESLTESDAVGRDVEVYTIGNTEINTDRRNQWYEMDSSPSEASSALPPQPPSTSALAQLASIPIEGSGLLTLAKAQVEAETKRALQQADLQLKRLENSR